MIFTKPLTLLFSLCFLLVLQAQDVAYTQYQYSPLLISPSYAVADNEFKAMVHYRNQYQLPNISYKSPSFTLIKPFMSAKKEYFRWGGLGISARSENFTGTPGYNFYAASAAYAHDIALGNRLHLALGAMAGYANISTESTSFSTGSQYSDNYGYNSSLPTGENASQFVKPFFDAGLGIHLVKEDEARKQKYFVAIAAYHIHQPDISLMGPRASLPVRLQLHGGYRIELKQNISLTPELFYRWQGTKHFVNIGARVKYKLNDASFSIIPRFSLSQVAGVGTELAWSNFFIVAHYDFNVSPSANVLLASGAYELAVGYHTPLGKRKQFKDIPDVMNANKKPQKSKANSKKLKKGFKQKERYIKPNN